MTRDRFRRLTAVTFATMTCALVALAAQSAEEPRHAHDSPRAVAELLIEAFDEHDVEKMAGLVTDDFELYYVSGGTIEVGARGRDELAKVMADYFASLPDVSSTVEDVIEGQRFVALYERVTWTSGEKTATQSSMAVYETEGNLISRVWYFPAEKRAVTD